MIIFLLIITILNSLAFMRIAYELNTHHHGGFTKGSKVTYTQYSER